MAVPSLQQHSDLTRPGPQVSRRALVGATVGTVLGAAGIAGGARWLTSRDAGSAAVEPGQVAAVEAARSRSGHVQNLVLSPQRSQVDLGGPVVTALTYGGVLPGRLVRVGAGDLLRVTIANQLDQATSVHWHGLAIRNDADGVPDVTGPEITAGTSAYVEFVVPDPGTYWLHPHSGLQLDWGLHAPIVVDDPNEPGGYDHELVVVLDDWTVGLGRTPEQILADLKAGRTSGGAAGTSRMSGMGAMSGMSGAGGSSTGSMGDAGDVAYPAYLANGRLASDPTFLAATPGQRVRLRIVNAAADTIFDVSLTGHRLRVTHSDGFPVVPLEVDTIRVAMGERYDAVVTLADGVFPLVATPLGKTGTPPRVILRTAAGDIPPADVNGADSRSITLRLGDLVATDAVRLPARAPDTAQDVVLGADMASYRWTINGRTYDDAQPLTVRQGQTTRLQIVNRTMMLHPIHLHGHTFAVRNGGDARKDTVLVSPMQRLDVDVRADNPGTWMLHCHNAFHMDAGMMTRLDYRA